jgi:GT2 family glycosyltransferase
MAVVDVITVTWNNRERIAATLDSIFALSELRADPVFAKVVVVDNGSTDGSAEFVRERYGDRVMLLETGSNLGFGGGCNRGIAATDSPYVYLLNSDAELRDRALAEIVAFMEAHPRCGMAGSKVLNPDESVQESCGEFDSWIGAYLRSSAWGEWPPLRRFGNGARLRAWDYQGERRVDLVIGAAMALRRRMLKEIGAFDERFFLYHEEVDLAKRAAAAGWETWFVPSSVAVHEGMGSAQSRSVVEAQKQRSRRNYWLKHHGRVWYGTLVAALIGRYALYAGVLAAIVFLIRRAIVH